MATPSRGQRAGVPEEDAADESISLKGTFAKDRKFSSILFQYKLNSTISTAPSISWLNRSFSSLSAVTTMMYAFGDDETPLPETVDLVEVSSTHQDYPIF